MEVLLTNQRGEVELTDLRFSIYGPAGSYILRIWCNSYFIDTDIIEVKSSVTDIFIIAALPQTVNI